MLDVRPVDPERMGRNGQLLREGADALGVSHSPLRRNAGACVQCSSCPIGCRLDAKRAMHVTYLPRAVAAGARVRAGVEARRIVFDGKRATGVECRAGVASAGGRSRPFAVRARRAVVLAGGAFGTPELLLRSGFRSPGGELGRNLRIHPACWVGARFDEHGARLGGRDAELRGRRVGGPRAAARGDLHPARLRRPVAAGHRGRAPAAAARVRQPRLDRGPPLRQVRRARRARLRRLAADRLPAHPRGRRPAALRDRARGRALLRRRARARSSPRSPAYRRSRGAGSPSSRPPPRAGARCGWRPSTRWGPRGWTPTPAAGSPAPTAPSTARRRSTSPTAACCRARIGVNPMMTIIAMASRVARQAAERLG